MIPYLKLAARFTREAARAGKGAEGCTEAVLAEAGVVWKGLAAQLQHAIVR